MIATFHFTLVKASSRSIRSHFRFTVLQLRALVLPHSLIV